jgi:hypothetical protein
VDIGTFPNGKENPPIRIENYEGRIWVEHDTRLAWGELAYARPLSEKELYHYELKPSRNNPDLRRLLDAQAQVVGKWEDEGRIPDGKRLTWFYPDFGCYVVKEFVSSERLAECARGGELQQEAAGRKRARQEKAPIAAQLREAGKLAGERQRPPPRPNGTRPTGATDGVAGKKRRRPVHLHVMVSEEEQALIQERMARRASTTWGPMRRMALCGYVLQIDLAPVRELVSLQRRCSNNLNQVAIHANTYGGGFIPRKYRPSSGTTPLCGALCLIC